MFNDVVLVAAKRTPIGKFLGSLSVCSAPQLSAAVIKAILADLRLEPAEVTELIVGQVLTAGVGQNPARQAAVLAGIPYSVPSFVVNQVCGSGLKSVCMAATLIQHQPDSIILAGGQESMSKAPHFINIRTESKRIGDAKLIDLMVHDGLTDVYNSYHMGITAENLATKFNVSRKEQDEFAVASQNKAESATSKGYFKDEIVPVEGLAHDEFIRSGATVSSISDLKPAFKKDGGTVTAANSSGVNDGAAVLAVTSRKVAKARGFKIIANIISYGQAGVEPEVMGIGPVMAVRKALDYAHWKVGDLDCIEANEAFAVQAIAVNKQLGWDISKVNMSGGAIALGHPIGASGARCLTTLLHNMVRLKLKKGLVTLCIGGGMGIAMCVERDL